MKLPSFRTDSRILHSDNQNTYFSLSDFSDDADGLYSQGIKLFSAILISRDNDAEKMKYKINSPSGFEIYYTRNYVIRGELFKNGNGLLIECERKQLFFKKQRKYTFSIIIPGGFVVESYNDYQVILKYTCKKENSFGYKEYYCAVSIVGGYKKENLDIFPGKISLTVVPDENPQKCPGLYFLYSAHPGELTKSARKNQKKIDLLKKENLRFFRDLLESHKSETGVKHYTKALYWSIVSGYSFIMEHKSAKSIWAGFPGFTMNRVRDTLIALPGISLVNGRYDEARAILENLANYQCRDKESPYYGKIPGVILPEGSAVYNTADTTPLFIREVYEYFLYTGDLDCILSLMPALMLIVEAVYLKHKDKEGFMCSNDAEDWMDSVSDENLSFCARANRPVEIQALWYTALVCTGLILEKLRQERKNITSFDVDFDPQEAEKLLRTEAARLKQSIEDHFTGREAPYIYDHLNSDLSKDTKVRPNGLLAVYFSSLPLVPPLFTGKQETAYFEYICPRLVFPQGVASLSSLDEDFHPLSSHSAFSTMASCHNGVIWPWLNGPFIHFACKYGASAFAFGVSENASHGLLESAALGSISELFDPVKVEKGRVSSAGESSQAWSVAEFSRSFFQDYCGIRCNVPGRELYLSPGLPPKLGHIKTVIAYGFKDELSIHFKVNKTAGTPLLVEIGARRLEAPLHIILDIPLSSNTDPENGRNLAVRCTFLSQRDELYILFDGDGPTARLKTIQCAGKCELVCTKTYTRDYQSFDNLQFAPDIKEEELDKYPAVIEENYLKRKISES